MLRERVVDASVKRWAAWDEARFSRKSFADEFVQKGAKDG